MSTDAHARRVDVVDGARGRSLCVSELSGRSEAFAELVQRIEFQISGSSGWTYPPVGSVVPSDSQVEEVLARIAEVDLGVLTRETDPLVPLIGLGAAVDAAMPWQPPFMRDAVFADPRLVDALRPTGRAIASSPACSWWASDLDLAHQYEAALHPPPAFADPVPAAEALAALRRGQAHIEARPADRPDDPADESSGDWWSMPSVWAEPGQGAVLPSSSRRLPSIGAVELAAQEDSYGPEHALLRRLRPEVEHPRVLEVHGPADWARLVAAHPFEVSRSRRGVWWNSTGVDGRWYVPDWRSAADEFDAVHVSVHAYLTTAGEAVPVLDGATVLAGWNPDVTFWLCDVTTAAVEHWRRTSEQDLSRWEQEPEGLVPHAGLLRPA